MNKELMNEYKNKVIVTSRNRKLSKIKEKEIARAIQSGTSFTSSRMESYFISRFEARHIMLAYGFLRGKPYNRIEKKCAIRPSPAMISNIANVESSIIVNWLDGLILQQAECSEHKEVEKVNEHA